MNESNVKHTLEKHKLASPMMLLFTHLFGFYVILLVLCCQVSSEIQGDISTGDSAIVEAFSDLNISCSWKSKNESYDGQDILWFFKKTDLNLTDLRFYVFTTNVMSTITLKNVSFSYSGLYSCKVSDFEEYLSTKITVGISPEKPKNISCWTRNTIDITCSWMSVGDTNLPVTYKFEYTVNPGPHGLWETCPDLHNNSCYIDTRRSDVTIKSGDIYMRVTATNALGSAQSDSFLFNPDFKVVTYPPTNLNVKAKSSSEIWLTFHRPDDTEELLTYFEYKVRYYTEWSPNQIVELTKIRSHGDEVNYPPISNLESYTNYTFQVSCQPASFFGIWSAWSEPSSGKTWESMPGRSVVIDKVEQSFGSENLLRDVNIIWQPLAERDKHGVILHSEVSVNQIAKKVTKENTSYLDRINSTLTDYTFSDLLRYVSYNITIRACNSVACSSPAIYLLSEDVDKPSEPQNVIAQPLSKSSVKLTWDEPGEPNGLIELYRVEYLQSDNSGVVDYSKTDQLEVIIEDLESFTLYYFSVQAKTKKGYGGFSPRISEKTLEDVPDAPPQKFEGVVVNQNTVDLSWQPPPVKNQRGDIINYTVYYCLTNNGAASNFTNQYKSFNSTSYPTTNIFPCPVQKQRVEGSAKRTSLSGLKEKRNYSLWMSASNAVGEGPITEPLQLFLMDQLIPYESQELPGQTVGLAVGITVGVAFVVILVIVLAIYHPILLEKIGVGNYFTIAEPKLPFLDSSDSYQYVNATDAWMGNGEPGARTKYMEIFDTLLCVNEPDPPGEKKCKAVDVNNTCSADACETCQIQQTSGQVAYRKSQSADESRVVTMTRTTIPDDMLSEDDPGTEEEVDGESEEDLVPRVRAANNPNRMSSESYSSNDSYDNYQRVVGVNGNLFPLLSEGEIKGEASIGKSAVRQLLPKAQSQVESSPEVGSPVSAVDLPEEQINLLSESRDYVSKDKLPPVATKELPKGYSALSSRSGPPYRPDSGAPSYCSSEMKGSSGSYGYIGQDSPLPTDYGSTGNSGYDPDSETSNSSCNSDTGIIGRGSSTQKLLSDAPSYHDDEHFSETALTDTCGGELDLSQSTTANHSVSPPHFHAKSLINLDKKSQPNPNGLGISRADGGPNHQPNAIPKNHGYVADLKLPQIGGATPDSTVNV